MISKRTSVMIFMRQTCSESQKVKSSQSHDFDFIFLPKNFIFKIKIERLKIFRIVKLVILFTILYKSHRKSSKFWVKSIWLWPFSADFRRKIKKVKVMTWLCLTFFRKKSSQMTFGTSLEKWDKQLNWEVLENISERTIFKTQWFKSKKSVTSRIRSQNKYKRNKKSIIYGKLDWKC